MPVVKEKKEGLPPDIVKSRGSFHSLFKERNLINKLLCYRIELVS